MHARMFASFFIPLTKTRGTKRAAFCLSEAMKNHGLPNIYIAPPLLGPSATLALTTSGASWNDMTAPDPSGTRRAPDCAPQH